MRTARFIAIVVLATVVLALPAAASADTLYVSPTGSGFPSPCSAASRCTLERAVEDIAVAGDAVQAAPGNYNVDGLTVPEAITLRGEPGAARPRIVGTATPLTVGPNADGTTIQRVMVDLVGTGLAVELEGEATIEDSQILVRGAGNAATDADALLAQVSSTVRDTTISANSNSTDSTRASVTASGGRLTLRGVEVTRVDNGPEAAVSSTRSAMIDADGLKVKARSCLRLLGTGASVIRNLTATQPPGAGADTCVAIGNASRIEQSTINSTIDHPAGRGLLAFDNAVVSETVVDAPSGDAVELRDNSRLDRSRISGKRGVQLFSDTAITNSVVVASGEFATRYGGAFGATARITDSTLLGGTGTSGFRKDGFGTVEIANTILVSGLDLDLATPGTVVGNSRFAGHVGEPYTNGGGNTVADPEFVDGPADDFRLAADSPLIDAGAPHGLLGPADVDGLPRLSGARPDIGAHEFQHPAPPADPPAPAPDQPASAGPGAGSPAAPVDNLLPVLRGAAVRPRRLVAGSRSGRLAFTLSEPAALSIAIAREQPGRRSGRRCVKPSRRLRRARRCTRLLARGTLKVDGKAGANSIPFTGRGLKPGPHRLTIVPSDAAGNRGAAVTARFTVVTRRKKS